MRNNYGQQVALFVLNWFTRPPLLQPPPSPRTKRMLLWRLRPSWASTRSTTCRPRGRRGTHDLSGLGLGFLQSSRISAHFSAMSRPTLCMACSSECPYAPHADWWLQPVLCPFHVSFPFFCFCFLLFFPFSPSGTWQAAPNINTSLPSPRSTIRICNPAVGSRGCAHL